MSSSPALRVRRTLSAVGAAALAIGALGACSAIGDAASDAGTRAACAVVTPIAESVGSQVQVVADDIAVDPSGAIDSLTSLQETVDGAAAAASGDIASGLESVSTRIGDLITQAEGVRDGGVVSQERIDEIETSIVTSLTSLVGDCGEATPASS